MEPVVADGDVDPAVEPHADAVGRVVAAPLVDQARRQAGDQHVLPIGRAVAVLVAEDAQHRRVQDPDLPVLRDHAPRMLHPGEHIHAVGLAVAVRRRCSGRPGLRRASFRAIPARPRPRTPRHPARRTGSPDSPPSAAPRTGSP